MERDPIHIPLRCPFFLIATVIDFTVGESVKRGTNDGLFGAEDVRYFSLLSGDSSPTDGKTLTKRHELPALNRLSGEIQWVETDGRNQTANGSMVCKTPRLNYCLRRPINWNYRR